MFLIIKINKFVVFSVSKLFIGDSQFKDGNSVFLLGSYKKKHTFHCQLEKHFVLAFRNFCKIVILVFRNFCKNRNGFSWRRNFIECNY